MNLVFLQRYEKLLNAEVASGTDNFLGGIGYVEHRRIARVLLDFCEPKNVPVSRYNNLTEKTNALVEAAYRFNNVLEYDVIDFLPRLEHGWDVEDEEEKLAWLDTSWLFSLIELLFDELSPSEKGAFRCAINTVFNDNDIPWLLVDGRMIKIDSKQFEQDMKRKAAEHLNELKDAAPVFQSSYDELVKAIEFLDKGNFAEAITNAAKSYESALKVLCNEENATPDKLTKTAVSNRLFELPDSMKPEGFQSQVLMSLPFIRNRPGAAHGAGVGSGEISRNMANLAVNLACALDTYIADEWAFGQQNDRD